MLVTAAQGLMQFNVLSSMMCQIAFRFKKGIAMTQQAAHSGDKLWISILVLTLLVTAGLFMWTSSHYQSDGKQGSMIDERGHVHVLGVTLGETTLRQAENMLQSRSDIALYIYPEGHPAAGMTLEAFFPSIADHSKIILLLDADIPLLHAIEERASVPHLYPNAVARMNLSPADTQLAQQLVVKELTLIPSVEVDLKSIRARFGQPEQEVSPEEGSLRLKYPAAGLTVTLSKDDATRLHFANPNSLP